MSTISLIFGGILALAMGFLAQQTVEVLMNTALAFLPFNIRTVK